jgi:Tol biopolymer transport system component
MHPLLRKTRIIVTAIVALAMEFASLAGGPEGPHVTNIHYLIKGNGGRVDWLPQTDTIAFDSQNSSGFTDAYTMKSDGSQNVCVTCSISNLSEHKGNPLWHPSGKFLLFQATDTSLSRVARSREQYIRATSPGSGWHNNLWAITPDGKHYWQLTHVGENQGLIHAHFDGSGKNITWAQLERQGRRDIRWSIAVGRFAVREGNPEITDVRRYQPDHLSFYETNDFSNDGTKILFMGKLPGARPGSIASGIYAFDINTGQSAVLVDPSEGTWNEHGHYTPDGRYVVWMSSRGDRDQQDYSGDSYTESFGTLKTDYWVMNSDGSDKQRLTFFNDSKSSMHIPGHVIASDLSFNPLKRYQMVSYVGDNPRPGHSGSIAVIDFVP